MGGLPSFTIPILGAPEPYSGTEVERRICPLVQSVGVRTPDMGRHFFHRHHAGRSVFAENVDIIAYEADRADSGVIPVSAFAIEFRED
jgi:hypothetical protein